MITSSKAKAIVGAVIAATLGILTDVVALGLVDGNAAKICAVIGTAITTLGVGVGVYRIPNAGAVQLPPGANVDAGDFTDGGQGLPNIP